MPEGSGGGGGPGTDRSGERRANRERSSRYRGKGLDSGEAVRGVRKEPGEREMAGNKRGALRVRSVGMGPRASGRKGCWEVLESGSVLCL